MASAVMKIPPAETKHLRDMYTIFSYSKESYDLRLNFIEPISTDTASIWRVEYRYNNSTHKYNLATFINELTQAIGQFEVTGIWQNTLGRIYIHVPPNSSNKQFQSPATVKTRSASYKRRSTKRAETFKQRIATLQNQAVEQGFKQDTPQSFIPLSKQKRIYQQYLDKVKDRQLPKRKEKHQTPKIAFVSGGIQTPTLITSVATQTNVTEVKETSYNVVPNLKPQSDIIKNSIASTEQRYAKGKLRDTRIFERVRRYLAVFLTDHDYTYIDSQGESKLSLEVKISSDGFPIGEELRQLFYSALQERGVPTSVIDCDLTSFRSFEQTSRLVRIQTAREKINGWYGKTGNLVQPVYHDYFSVNTLSTGRRSEAIISDQLGLITCFA